MSLPTEHAHDCPARIRVFGPTDANACTCGLAARIDAAERLLRAAFGDDANFGHVPPTELVDGEIAKEVTRAALERAHHLAENWRRIAERLLRAAFGDDANFGHVPPTELVDGEIAEQVTRAAREEMIKLALQDAEDPTHRPYRVTNTPMHYVVQGPLVDLDIQHNGELGETHNFENELIERAFNAAYRAGWISGREVGRNEQGMLVEVVIGEPGPTIEDLVPAYQTVTSTNGTSISCQECGSTTHSYCARD